MVADKPWQISAAYDAIFGARIENLQDTSLFMTYFPEVDDLKLIVATGISEIYFVGKIENPESVKLMNSLTASHIPLVITQLEVKNLV